MTKIENFTTLEELLQEIQIKAVNEDAAEAACMAAIGAITTTLGDHGALNPMTLMSTLAALTATAGSGIFDDLDTIHSFNEQLLDTIAISMDDVEDNHEEVMESLREDDGA